VEFFCREDTTLLARPGIVDGMTMIALPFKSIDFCEMDNIFRVSLYLTISELGAFYKKETEKIAMYTRNHIIWIFFGHAVDNMIKAFYFNTLAEQIMVWKNKILQLFNLDSTEELD
jgi:hypothetical protein